MGKGKKAEQPEDKDLTAFANYMAVMAVRQIRKEFEELDFVTPWNKLDNDQKQKFYQDRDQSPPRKSKKEKNTKKKKDPNLPKNARTGFIWFNQTTDSDILKKFKEFPENVTAKAHRTYIWNNLTDEEKAPYMKMYAADKERYAREMQLYKEGKFDRAEADKNEKILKDAKAEQQKEKIVQKEKKQKDKKKKKKSSSSSSSSSGSSSE